VLITNASTDTADVFYVFGAGLDLPSENILAYPNPLLVSEQAEITFKNIPEEGKIHIFNSNGEKIIHLEARAADETLLWNLQDMSNQTVSSGTYLYLFKGVNTEQKGKFVIIR
jgi:hypothetical protein